MFILGHGFTSSLIKNIIKSKKKGWEEECLGPSAEAPTPAMEDQTRGASEQQGEDSLLPMWT